MGKKYSKTFLMEVDRFARCGESGGDEDRHPTEEGLQQFFLKESKGVEPSNPDPYYTRLINGKKWWEWQLNEMAKVFPTADWNGWQCYAQDFIDDSAGFRQLRQRVGFIPVDPMEYIELCKDFGDAEQMIKDKHGVHKS